MIDTVDLRILAALQENARMSTAEIARRIDLAASAVHERIRKLEARGVIRGYGVRIDPEALSLGLTAFLFIESNERPGQVETAEEMARIPQVLEVHHVAGEDCFLLKVKARSNGDLARLLREKLGAIPSVNSSRTTIVLETIRRWPIFRCRKIQTEVAPVPRAIPPAGEMSTDICVASPAVRRPLAPRRVAG